MKSLKNYIKNKDLFLWIFVILSVLFGFTLIKSMQRSGEYNYFKNQSFAVFTGLIIAIIVSNIEYKYIISKWYLFAMLGIFLATLVFVFGIRVSGTDDTAWISLFGITIQPSEFIKICFIITFSKHLDFLNDNNKLKTFWGVFSLAVHALIPMAVIHMQGDDGAVLIFGFIFLIMSFCAGVQLRYFFILGAVTVLSIPIIWLKFFNNEHRNRIKSILDIDGNSATNYGWQQYQGKLSIASGKMYGSGLFKGSRVESGIVPEQENDFIFTVLGEELGFVGCLFLIVLFIFLFIRILSIYKKCNNFSGKCICSGVFAIITTQTIINLAMVLGYLPVIGITLPFYSAGGSSVLSMLICIGIVESVCDNRK